MKEVTRKTFHRQVFKSQKPVLVYFCGQSCYPCKRIEPILSDLSEEFSKDIKCVKFIIDEDTFEYAKRFNIKAGPTLLIFKSGVMLNSLVGFVPKSVLRTFLEESIKLSKKKRISSEASTG